MWFLIDSSTEVRRQGHSWKTISLKDTHAGWAYVLAKQLKNEASVEL